MEGIEEAFITIEGRPTNIRKEGSMIEEEKKRNSQASRPTIMVTAKLPRRAVDFLMFQSTISKNLREDCKKIACLLLITPIKREKSSTGQMQMKMK